MRKYYLDKLYQKYLHTQPILLWSYDYYDMINFLQSNITHLSFKEFKDVYLKDKQLVFRCLNDDKLY